MIKYMPGDIYFNSIVSGLSAVAVLLTGKLQKIINLKGGLIMSIGLVLVSCIILTFFDAHTD